jgi:hypothetical protein
MKPLLERLHELGYAEGKNAIFEYRSAEDHPERLPELAAELVRASPLIAISGHLRQRRRSLQHCS